MRATTMEMCQRPPGSRVQVTETIRQLGRLPSPRQLLHLVRPWPLQVRQRTGRWPVLSQSGHAVLVSVVPVPSHFLHVAGARLPVPSQGLHVGASLV